MASPTWSPRSRLTPFDPFSPRKSDPEAMTAQASLGSQENGQISLRSKLNAVRPQVILQFYPEALVKDSRQEDQLGDQAIIVQRTRQSLLEALRPGYDIL